MVIPRPRTTVRKSGALTTDAMVALAILLLALVPLVVSVVQERKLLRAYYTDAIAMEIVDGELERLRAGEWRAYPDGSQDYRVRAASAANLPPGRFVLRVGGDRLRLEWIPDGRGRGARVARETSMP